MTTNTQISKMEAKERMEIARSMYFQPWKIACQCVFSNHCIW